MRAPCLVESLKHIKVAKVECGSNFTIAIGSNNNQSGKSEVYGWGCNEYQQLGLERCDKRGCQRNEYEQLQSLSDMVRRTNDMNSNNINRLNIVVKPMLVTSFPNHNVLDFSCGHGHSLFLLDDKSIHSCGLNDSGQCGIPISNERIVKIPQRLCFNKSIENQIKTFSAGKAHSLFLSSRTGIVYQCGRSNKDGGKTDKAHKMH